ncbi:T9SS type A sorting domain-containing protein, partial [bacterium]|nr:T9SS type A sorting domain-containing protein [bacterium]
SSGLDLYRSWNSGMFWDQQTHWEYPFGHPDFVHADHHEIVFHPDNPDEVWAVTDGGIFRSTDEGENWTEMNQGYNTYQYYAMGNATLDTMLAYGGTQDNGTSRYNGNPNWNEVFGGDGGYCVVDYTDDDVVYVEYQYGNRYRSDDGGFTFTSINAGIGGTGAWVTPMILDPFEHNTIYTTTTNGGVWESRTRGDFSNWENIGPAGSQNQVMAASPIVPDLLYVGSNSTVYRRDPESGEWSSITGNLPGRTVTRVVPDPFSPDGVYVTVSGFGGGHVYKSTQGGNVWEDISGNLPDAPVQDVIVDLTEPGTLYAGGDLGVYRTLDGGEHWDVYGEGMPVVRVDDMEMQSITGKLRVATHGRGMWEIQTGSSDLALLYPNGGETLATGAGIEFRWAGLTHAGNVGIDINRDYPNGAWETLIPATNNDGAESWTVSGPTTDNARFRIVHGSIAGQSDTTDADTRIAIPMLELIYPNGGETVLTGGFDTLMYNRIMVDEPLRIELNRNYPDGEWEVLQEAIGFLDSYRWMVRLPGGDHCRFRITSTERPELTAMSESDFTIRAPHMTILSPNGGEQVSIESTYEIRWEALEHNGRVRISLNRDYPDGEWEILNANASNSGLLNWNVTGPETEHARVRVAVQLDPLQSYVESTADFEIFTLGAEEASIPSEFSISDAYPNPFNPSTQVRLELPVRTNVDARVFNHLGQQVALLVNDNLEPGSHRITFDASSLSSGTYFIHITALDETKILKAVLLK